ncbi:MAG TPA: DoxX family membrane protein [Candidatus Limnocylindrales bacterium]|jgi:thiosulfate dehydrogenase [quinone] large subunit
MSNRSLATIVGAIAAILLVYAANPWVQPPEGTIRTLVNVGFWVAAIALAVILFQDRKSAEADEVEIEGPAFARFLFGNSRAGMLWLPIRLFLGFAWLDAGIHKVTDPAWTTGGEALRGYWERAAAIPEQGRPPITYEWYRDFINTLLAGGHETWFSWVIMLGEIAVGIGLIFGILTGIAAFFGALMNMSFLLAGSASTNPVLFTLAVGLMLAWKVAGYYGVDRWLLPSLGTPWRPGSLAAGRVGDPRTT